jgi:hypothetical protein
VTEFEAGLQQGLGDHVGTVIAESFHYFERIGPDGLAIADATGTAEALGVTLTPLEDWIRSQDWSTTRTTTAGTPAADPLTPEPHLEDDPGAVRRAGSNAGSKLSATESN